MEFILKACAAVLAAAQILPARSVSTFILT